VDIHFLTRVLLLCLQAIKGMKCVIDNLVDQAYQGNTYDQALGCLRALRRGCIVQSVSPSMFAMHSLYKRCVDFVSYKL
jgi:hypothetical protein